jgi:hypothetical protein
MNQAEIIKCGCCGETAEANECLYDPELHAPTCTDCTQSGITAKILLKQTGISPCTDTGITHT